MRHGFKVSRDSKGNFTGITGQVRSSLDVMGCAVSGAKYPILARFPFAKKTLANGHSRSCILD